MEKKFYAIIAILLITAMIFVSCKSKETEEVANPTDDITVSQTADNASETESSTAEATKESTTESTSESTTKATTKESTTKESTTKETTKKETTTQKQSTTKKNVTGEEVQRQVNDYIKSKGVTLDSSLNGNSSDCYKGEWSNTSNL